MDNNRVITWLAIIGVISLIALSFFIGRKSVQPKITTEVICDTVRVEVPVPYKVETVRKEYVYVTTPADTVVKEVVQIDSVLVAVDIERRVYGDERYRAVVSGAVVGNIHPTLDEIDIYSRNETRVIEHKAPICRPYIRGSVGKELMGIGGGVSFKDRVDVDMQYMRVGKNNMVVVGANYRFNIKNK
jgi:hypothetical protein